MVPAMDVATPRTPVGGPVRIFHVTERQLWEAAQQSGAYTGSTRGASLAEVGFVHCSFPEQIEKVTNYLYADDATADLVVLEIDTDRLDAEVRVENLDGGDELFPHIYGPVPVAAVVGTRKTRPTS